MGAEIEAPASGIVTDVKWQAGYGNMVTLDHGYGLVTRYAHCSKILVARGQRVKRGQKIARSEEHTSELQSQSNLVCRLLLEKKKKKKKDKKDKERRIVRCKLKKSH